MSDGRVFWSDKEKKKLVDTVFVMRQNDPDASLISIINRAQEQFPTNRQRNIPSAKVIPWLSRGLRNRFKELRDKANELESAKTEVETAKEGQTEIKERLSGMLKKAREDAVGKLTVEDLAIELITRLDTNQREMLTRLDALEQRISEVTKSPLARRPIGRLETAPPPPKTKKVILVVGMLNEQAERIKQRFKGRADLRFRGGDDTQSSLPQADVVLINGKFVAHKVQNRVKASFNGPIEIVHGGQSVVSDKLAEIINRG